MTSYSNNFFTAFVIFLLVQYINFTVGNENNAEFIKEINRLQSDWEAEENEFTDLDTDELRKLMGLKLKPEEERSHDYYNYDIEVPENIPASFDARDKWPQCSSIKSIKDQSNCGSCWAVSSSSAMSDRLCIASKFQVHVNLSAEALMTCCEPCTDGDPGCDGGYLDEAWKYWSSHGLVTGGDYGSYEGCQPYGIKPCRTCSQEATTPPCIKHKCTNLKYRNPYKQDIKKGKNFYAIPNKVALIQADILKNGPLTTGFTVYKDFMSYKNGVYRHVKGNYMGHHAVRILGWGVDSNHNTPYWLVANSWARWWGDEGLFKILRGTNECQFEDNVYTGLPKIA